MPRVLTENDGVGSFPSMVSPFTRDEEFDLNACRREVHYDLELGASGLCVGGSAGEGHALEASESGAIVKAAQGKRNGGGAWEMS
jgi:4-hydroxy-tetrahydrodipicolinate synthase